MMRLHDFLDFHAREGANVDFAIFEGQTMSYSEARRMANRLAHAFIDAGLKIGDRVAYLSKNSIEYPVFFYACSKAGVVPVPLNFRLAPAEWAYIINDAGAKMAFVSPEYAEGIASVKDRLKTVSSYFVVSNDSADGYESFYEWIEGKPDTNPDRVVSPECDLYQMYTSGTTGHPKGAVLKQGAVTTQIHQFQYSIPRRKGERTLVVAPMYHAAAGITFMAAVATGGTMYIMEDFHPVEVVRVLSEENIHHSTLVPAMIQACLVMVPDAAQRKYDSLRTIAYGASPIAEEVLRKAMDVLKCEFYQGYGMTETTAVLTILSNEDHKRALNGEPHLLLAAGRPLAGTEVKIFDENDTEVPRGTIGEICGRGPQLMSGYWNLDEASEKALKGGWMHTGDAGRMDDEGFVFVEDRVKDMIISGGENVYPREVENCLFQHEAIADCAVIGIPSEKWGETIKAIVCFKDGLTASEDEIIAHCRDRIAHYKCPTSVEPIAELPRNASGKVLKRELREKYWEGQSRRVS